MMLLFGWRRDSGLRRTLNNCLLMAILAVVAVAFFSCTRRLLVRTTPQMDIESRYWIRVLLANDITQCTVSVRGEFSVRNNINGELIPQSLYLRPGTTIDVNIIDGRLAMAGGGLGVTELTIQPGHPYIFTIDGDDYRGKLILKLNPAGSSFDAINIVPIEPYLAGVVGSEMPSYWEHESLKAQAIAARTYCLYHKAKFGPKRDFDVTKTAANQVYRGVKAETRSIWKAVDNTTGKVLVCKQAHGVEDIFPTYYSSACGGHTENSKNVFGDSFAPLAGVACPYCKEVAKPNIFFWPMVQLEKQKVSSALRQRYSKLNDLGDITAITTAAESDYKDFARLTMLRVQDSAGKTGYLRAEDFRLTLDPSGNKLRSAACKIVTLGDKWSFFAGRGFGHGVGLCQCGAEAMARKGHTAEEILAYYYPGSKLIRAY